MSPHHSLLEVSHGAKGTGSLFSVRAIDFVMWFSDPALTDMGSRRTSQEDAAWSTVQ